MHVDLPALGSTAASAWDAIFDICDAATTPWTLVGGQMVYLHAIENGVELPRPTIDADVLVDVRLEPQSTRRMTIVLQGLGFDLDEERAGSGAAHRFRRGDAVVDVLAPDNLGDHASLITVPPGQTVEAPGGTHALRRTSQVEVRISTGRTAYVPRPDLLGAAVIKAAAVARLAADTGHERHAQDLALLLGLIPDPFALLSQMSAGEQRVLKQAMERMGSSDPAWAFATEPDSALLALRILAGAR